MSITMRLFRDMHDLQQLTAFVTACVADPHHPCYWQLGDLLWGMYQNTFFEPTRHIALWFDEHDTLLGFVWSDRYGVSMQTHPCLMQNDQTLQHHMLDWAEQHYHEHMTADGVEPHLWCSAYDSDTQRIAILTAHGFTPTDRQLLHMHQPLDRAIPAPTLPAGWRVEHIAHTRDYAQRVAIHRDVWHPSRVTLDAYERLRHVPGYTPELDLVAVAPDGTFGAYCICWHDSTNHHGEFEPVGTRAAFRRKGLGRAVMLEGLRRLRERNVTTAIVYAIAANEASWQLYESVGFRTVNVERSYTKPARRATTSDDNAP